MVLADMVATAVTADKYGRGPAPLTGTVTSRRAEQDVTNSQAC